MADLLKEALAKPVIECTLAEFLEEMENMRRIGNDRYVIRPDISLVIILPDHPILPQI